MATTKTKTRKAVAYCRVSSQAQVKRGHGLDSQESRCVEYAKHRRYSVEHVFQDEGVSGGLIERPGMQAMLAFLQDNRCDDEYVVIIDDISRLARSLEAHLQLRAAIGEAGGVLESPSIEFGEDSDSILIENLLASVSQHSRQKNAEQVTNRMKARVKQGYYIFYPPLGYRFENVDGHGKMLVPDEPNASVVKEALEGYASGRFQSATEVKRFLETFPTIPRDKYGEVRLPLVTDMLKRPLYAGYITVEKWNLHLHPGKHEPLVEFVTWQRVQERYNGASPAPARKDINEDFPLRNFVCCSECEKPMKAAWAKGRNERYAYYFCMTKGCDEYRKSIRKEKMEAEFESFLRELQPRPGLFHIAKDMFIDLWNMRLASLEDRKASAAREVKKLDTKIDQIMERLIEAESKTLISAYENQIKKLEGKKLVLSEKLGKGAKPEKSFEEIFRTAITFLANPWKLWASDVLAHKRMVLRLVFPGRADYCRKEGFRTAGIAMPFRLLGRLMAPEYGMVDPSGIEPLTSSLPAMRSPS